MTRFARAKGSKSSNERVPEDSTKWSVMKQQMLQSDIEKQRLKKQKEFDQKREENYKAFMSERENQLFTEPLWAEFSDNDDCVKSNKNAKSKKLKQAPDVQETKKNKNSNLNEEIDKFCNETSLEVETKYEKLVGELENKINKLESNKKSTKKRKISENGDDNFSNNNQIKKKSNNDVTSKESMTGGMKKKKSKKNTVLLEVKNKKVKKSSVATSEIQQQNNDNLIGEIKKKTKKVESTENNNLDKNYRDSDDEAPTEESIIKIEPIIKLARKKNKSKNKKPKQIVKSVGNGDDFIENTDNEGALTEESIIKTELIVNKKTNKKNAKKIKNPNSPKQENNENHHQKGDQMNNNERNNQKLNRNKKLKERRKPESNKPQYVVVNGEKQEIILFSGFPIKKSDAERLDKLKSDMIEKGIPRNEIFHTLKLERRKAEKALSRDRKRVCFQCRKSGHLLSDCPEIDKGKLIEVSAVSGICFKCGSTEHISFDCKVVKGNTFKFAKCFICNEQGHISKQCPDNPRGLYPKGGGCRICDDVTHLKKDCPQFQQKQEESTMTLNTLTSLSNVEDDFDDDNMMKSHSNERKKFNKQKIVKF